MDRSLAVETANLSQNTGLLAIFRWNGQILSDRGRAAATATAELLELIDIGQHLGHGGKEPLGDLLTNLGGVLDGPGQGRRGHHRDVVFPRYLPDLHRHLVHPLGQHLGSGAWLARVVFQGH
mgnify:CR=1 FL=1